MPKTRIDFIYLRVGIYTCKVLWFARGNFHLMEHDGSNCLFFNSFITVYIYVYILRRNSKYCLSLSIQKRKLLHRCEKTHDDIVYIFYGYSVKYLSWRRLN